MATKRIAREYQRFIEDPLPVFTVSTVTDDPYQWNCVYYGQPNTPYDGGTFHFIIKFPTDYPFKPFRIFWRTKIFHPNIPDDYHVMVPELCEWTPKVTICEALPSLQKLLHVPIEATVDLPCLCCIGYSSNIKVQEEYHKSKEEFARTAKEWTKLYASSSAGNGIG